MLNSRIRSALLGALALTTGPLLAQDLPVGTPGELLPPSDIGPSWVEPMSAVAERQSKSPIGPTYLHRSHHSEAGQWVMPKRSTMRRAHSGTRYATNKWGDTRMGIGFNAVVDLDGTWIAGQSVQAMWPSAVMVIGYRDGSEVARTTWFEGVADEYTWFPIGLEDVDRVEFVARPAVDGAAFYAIDDLAFARADMADGPVVLDFDELAWRTKLTGSGYAGLTWESGTGEFEGGQVSHVHPPLTPPGLIEIQERSLDDPLALSGVATPPVLTDSFVGPRLGDNGAGWLPPDTCGAVGTTQFLAVVNQHISVYQKATGTRMLNSSLQNFFNTTGHCGDPRAAYDHFADRWIVIAGDFDQGVRLAISETDDAMGNWFKTFITFAGGSDASNWPDYPTLGFDENGIYMSAYMVGGNYLMSIFAVDKAPLLQATPSVGTVSAWRQLPWEGAIQPCATHGDSGGVYLVSRRNSTKLRVRQIVGALTSPSLVETGSVTIPVHSGPPSAPAMGSTVPLSTVGSRPMNAVYRNGSVWTAHCIDVNGKAASRWYELDPVAVNLVQHDTITDTERHYFFPALAVNALGDMVIGFSGSSPNEFASAYFSGRLAADAPGFTATPALLKAGVAPYNQSSSGSNRWGDYSLTSMDPIDDSFWTIQEYARNNNNWGTFIGRLESGVDVCVGAITTFCIANTNSTGLPAEISATGSTNLADNNLTLSTVQLPLNKFGYYLFSETESFIPDFGGSQGILCLGSPLVRFAGNVLNSGASGTVSFMPDLGNLPQGTIISAGETWLFQLWYRDNNPGSTSNTSNGLSVSFCE